MQSIFNEKTINVNSISNLLPSNDDNGLNEENRERLEFTENGPIIEINKTSKYSPHLLNSPQNSKNKSLPNFRIVKLGLSYIS